MVIKELIAALQAIVEADEFLADMQVTFGSDVEPVSGGRICKDDKGLVVLNLAPIKLDAVGGF